MRNASIVNTASAEIKDADDNVVDHPPFILKATPTQAYLPRALLLAPPLFGKRHLCPFDLAIASVLIAAARMKWNEERHKLALKAGGETIEREKAHAAAHKEAWRKVREQRSKGQHDVGAPQRMHTFAAPTYKPKRASYRKAGEYGFRKAQKSLRQAAPPDTITITIASRSALLQLAGFSTGGDNLQTLAGSLWRLREPVRIGNVVPFIANFRNDASGHLQITLFGSWLAPPFAPVPLPLPTRSPVALALYFWLYALGVETQKHRGQACNTEAVYRRLGIDLKRGPFTCGRALDDALNSVNNHLATLPAEAFMTRKRTLARKFEIRPFDGGRSIRFQESFDDDGPAREAAAPIKQPKRERPRLTPEARARHAAQMKAREEA